MKQSIKENIYGQITIIGMVCFVLSPAMLFMTFVVLDFPLGAKIFMGCIAVLAYFGFVRFLALYAEEANK